MHEQQRRDLSELVSVSDPAAVCARGRYRLMLLHLSEKLLESWS